MMQSYRFFGMKVCQPAKAETERPAFLFRSFEVLMRSLQRGNCEILRRDQTGFADHLILVRSIAMESQKQRRGCALGNLQIVIELDLGGECFFGRLGSRGLLLWGSLYHVGAQTSQRS